MYPPTETENGITPTSWFYQLSIYTPPQTIDPCSSRFQIILLLDTGASIFVLNLPTYTILAERLNINAHTKEQQKTKTLTVANQTEVPILP